jgi:hypothetical protein
MKATERKARIKPVHKQRRVQLNGHRVQADIAMIPLLKALNKAGLITRSHCQGGKLNPAFVSIELDSIEGAEVHMNHKNKRLLLSWFRKSP